MFDVLITKKNEDTEIIRKVENINYEPDLVLFATESNVFGININEIERWHCFPVDFLLK